MGYHWSERGRTCGLNLICIAVGVLAAYGVLNLALATGRAHFSTERLSSNKPAVVVPHGGVRARAFPLASVSPNTSQQALSGHFRRGASPKGPSALTLQPTQAHRHDLSETYNKAISAH